MGNKATDTTLLVRALLKLDQESGERRNLILFFQSCYGGRVRSYDFDAALESLGKLTDPEQHALITYVIRFC
jgi:hypothetical protein